MSLSRVSTANVANRVLSEEIKYFFRYSYAFFIIERSIFLSMNSGSNPISESPTVILSSKFGKTCFASPK